MAQYSSALVNLKIILLSMFFEGAFLNNVTHSRKTACSPAL